MKRKPARSRMTAAACVVCLLLWPGAWAEEELAADNGQSATESASETNGDIVTLRSGRELRGFLVVRETPSYYELEIVEDRIVLRVPRSQVLSVQYDQEAHRRRVRMEAERQRNPVLLPGLELSEEMAHGLIQDISRGQEEVFEGDFIEVLNYLRTRARVRVDIQQEIRDIEPGNRAWTFSLRNGGTFQHALQALDAAFPALRVVYEPDRVRIDLRDEVQESDLSASDGQEDAATVREE